MVAWDGFQLHRVAVVPAWRRLRRTTNHAGEREREMDPGLLMVDYFLILEGIVSRPWLSAAPK